MTEDGLSFRDLIMEVRSDVRKLFGKINDLEDSVVTKTELDLWKATQVTTRRWAIGVIISFLVLAFAIVGLILQQHAGGI